MYLKNGGGVCRETLLNIFVMPNNWFHTIAKKKHANPIDPKSLFIYMVLMFADKHLRRTPKLMDFRRRKIVFGHKRFGEIGPRMEKGFNFDEAECFIRTSSDDIDFIKTNFIVSIKYFIAHFF